MESSAIEEFRKVRLVMRGIPKRERSNMKRSVRQHTLQVLDPNNTGRPNAMHVYRRLRHVIAANDRAARRIGNAKAQASTDDDLEGTQRGSAAALTKFMEGDNKLTG